jgi:hypothetical protein
MKKASRTHQNAIEALHQNLMSEYASKFQKGGVLTPQVPNNEEKEKL